MKRTRFNIFGALIALVLILSILLTGCSFINDYLPNGDVADNGGTNNGGNGGDNGGGSDSGNINAPSVTLDTIPEFDGKTPYVIINENAPFFTDEKTDEGYELFTPLDELGRCGTALACITVDLLPTDKREEIGHIYPSGWQSVKYDIVSGKYLYNRSHLIGFQLTGENDNELNLVTGTRFMNVEGMLPFENMVADLVKDGVKVLYRVTPIFKDNELVCRGVLMEALSIGETPEDNGLDIEFCVYVYNNQPGVVINYLTGESVLDEDYDPDMWAGEEPDPNEKQVYILNTSSMKFHLPSCGGAANIAEHNREESTLDRETLMERGYSPCGTCDP